MSATATEIDRTVFHLEEEPHHEEGSSTMLGFWLYLMSDCLIFAMLFAVFGVLGGDTDLLEPPFVAGPHFRVGVGDAPPVDQGLDVHHGPAAEDRHVAPVADPGDLPLGLVPEVRDTRGVGDIEDVESVVRDAAPLIQRQLGGPDLHAAVLLHRVTVHDLAAEALGQIQREFRFAGARRPDHGDRGRPVHDHHPTW